MSLLFFDLKELKNNCYLSYLQERLKEKFDIFDCRRPDLNDFVRNDIYSYQEQGIATSYVLENGDGKILSFVSLSAGALKLEGTGLSLPGLRKAELPKQLPALTIGRLGTDISETKKGYAEILIRFATLLALKIRGDIGCFFILVDAYTDPPEIVGFYQNRGFLLVSSPKKGAETVKMYHRLDEPMTQSVKKVTKAGAYPKTQ